MATAAQESTSTAVARTPEQRAAAVLSKDAARKMITELLPPNVTFGRFLAIVQMQVAQQPELADCTQVSLVTAVCKALRYNLEIGETVHLVPFNVNVGTREQPEWEKRCQAIRDYKGTAEMIIRAGAARAIEAECVYEGEHFRYEKGLTPILEHQPSFAARQKGNIIAVYAIARLSRYDNVFHVMSIDEVEAIRKKSKQWSTQKVAACPPWYAKKTAVNQLAKLLPKFSEVKQYFAEDEDELTALPPLGKTPLVNADGYDMLPPHQLPPNPDELQGAAHHGNEPEFQEEPAAAASAPSKPQHTTGGPACPKCGGAMWDNRATKRNPRAPDFKCRNDGKQGRPVCDGVIWPPREGEVRDATGTRRPIEEDADFELVD